MHQKSIRAALWLLAAALFTGCASPRSSPPATPSTAGAPQPPIFTTPKLDVLNEQIARNPSDPQTFSNRGYVLALLGRKEEARADLRKTIELKDNAPMHNRVGWAYACERDTTFVASRHGGCAETHLARYIKGCTLISDRLRGDRVPVF